MTASLRWTVAPDHPAFSGHFPGTAILPGVVLLDTALTMLAAATGIALDRCTISSAKFLSPALPGDEIVIRHEVTRSGTIRFELLAGEQSTRIVASGTIVPASPR